MSEEEEIEEEIKEGMARLSWRLAEQMYRPNPHSLLSPAAQEALRRALRPTSLERAQDACREALRRLRGAWAAIRWGRVYEPQDTDRW